MSLCPICGLTAWGSVGICFHHGSATWGTDWAKGNKEACDFFHRGIEPPKRELTLWEREIFHRNLPLVESFDH